MENKNKRVLGYKLATKITHEEMNAIAGGVGKSGHRTYGTTNEYTYPIGIDIMLDFDQKLDS